MISGFNLEREVEQLRIAQEFHQGQIERIEERIRELKEEEEDAVEVRDLFNPDETSLDMHLDYLEAELDFNLGQVYGFFDLDKQSQVDLAQLAVEYELDRESVQNILNICRALGALDGGRDNSTSARAGDAL